MCGITDRPGGHWMPCCKTRGWPRTPSGCCLPGPGQRHPARTAGVAADRTDRRGARQPVHGAGSTAKPAMGRWRGPRHPASWATAGRHDGRTRPQGTAILAGSCRPRTFPQSLLAARMGSRPDRTHTARQAQQPPAKIPAHRSRTAAVARTARNTSVMTEAQKNKQAGRLLVPRLRFPEFRWAGEWEETRLGDIGSVRMCKRILKEQTRPRGDIPFYKIGTFGGVPDAYISREIFENFRSSYPFPKNGAVLISAAGTIGRTVRYNGELAYFQDSNIVWLDNSEKLIADNFLFYLYQLIDWSPSVGAIQRLYNENILGAQVKFPSIPEQQKIADCLSSLDELIAAEIQQLDALKTHKKGLMQQLFPREGETVPRLRFPEFREAGEWAEAALGSISEFASGGTPSKDVSEYWGGKTPWISASSMYETNLYKSDLNITDLAVRDGARIAKQGALLILVRGSMLYNRVPMGIASVDVSFNQDVKALTIKDGINTVFLLYELLAYESRIPVDKTGIGAGKIETDELKRLPIYIPSSTEQQKIADCLSFLDDLITAQSQKIDALKTHKKGLMQQLFPVLDEAPA